jgi:hypothetical protein
MHPTLEKLRPVGVFDGSPELTIYLFPRPNLVFQRSGLDRPAQTHSAGESCAGIGRTPDSLADSRFADAAKHP